MYIRLNAVPEEAAAEVPALMSAVAAEEHQDRRVFTVRQEEVAAQAAAELSAAEVICC